MATGLDTYPDVSVVCGAEERDREDRLALVNPIVLVEVLSAATAAYDRGDPLEHYKDPDGPVVEVCQRHAQGWSSSRFGRGEMARLESIDCTMPVDEVFRDPWAEP
jgi:Uma2 family endonuclease